MFLDLDVDISDLLPVSPVCMSENFRVTYKKGGQGGHNFRGRIHNQESLSKIGSSLKEKLRGIKFLKKEGDYIGRKIQADS
ncbi:MAG: hypothetical protein WC668_01270 [Patescibacteria group bacterium]